MKTLVIVTGPTASGKTALAIDIAESLQTEIVSADSRQIYRGIPICTAVPSRQQLERVPHHFIETLDLRDYYSAAMFETDALACLDSIWRKSDYAVLCGGSMMYIDALTRGIDPLPTISPEVRTQALAIYTDGGLEALHDTLSRLDPAYLATAPDLSNHKRLIHAIEICLQAGKPCSSLLTGQARQRPFRTVKLAIGWPREQLFTRINSRVDSMMAEGLEEEARSVYHLRHLNSLNTVGFKEMFAMFDGVMTRDTAIPRIAKNTRVYAKKQLLWLSKDPSVRMVDPTSPLLGQALDAIREDTSFVKVY